MNAGRNDALTGPRAGAATRRQVATYDYRDQAGTLLSQVVRWEPKHFTQRRPDGCGGWVWDRNGVSHVPYRLPELLAADPAEWVWLVEGEKDADRLASLGAVATTNPDGAGGWRREFARFLAGRQVAVVADKDEAGQTWSRSVCDSLAGVATGVVLLEVPIPGCKDTSDYLDAGGSLEALKALADRLPKSPLPSPKDKKELSPYRTREWVDQPVDLTGHTIATHLGDLRVVNTIAGRLRISQFQPGVKFRCVMPSHRDFSPSASISQARGGTFRYSCFGCLGRVSIPLGEVWRAIETRRRPHMQRPELRHWTLRLLIAAGVLAPANLRLPEAPGRLAWAEAVVYNAWRDFLEAEWAIEPGRPKMFTERLIARLTGLSAWEAKSGRRGLISRHVLIVTGHYSWTVVRKSDGRAETRRSPLFLPGPAIWRPDVLAATAAG